MADKNEFTVEQISEMLKKAVIDGQKEAGEPDGVTREAMDEHVEGIIKDMMTPLNEKMAQIQAAQDEFQKAQAAAAKEEKKDDGKVYKRFGEFLADVIRVESPYSKGTEAGAKAFERLTKAATGLSESIPSDGGFLVQSDFSSELLRRVHETGLLPSMCRQVPISANANGLKINAVDETSRADGSRWGGVLAYWANEAAEKTASKPKFREMNLRLNKLIGLCYATDELLDDAAALESVVMQAFEEEFGFMVDDALLNGSGAGQPLGILNAACLVSQAAESGQVAATVVAENIIKMRARLWARSRGSAVWMINQDVEEQLHQMSLPVGTGGLPVYLPANGLSGQPYDMLFGRPIMPMEQCQTLGTVGDVILGDWSQYLLIDKGTMQSDQSIHVRFIYDETCFRFVYRVDGQPIWNSALTPFNSTTTLSPFVALATRA